MTLERVVSEGERLAVRNEARTLKQKWVRWWKNLPRRARMYGPEVIGWAGVLGVSAWEIRNATLGFQQLWHPGWLWAIIGAVGACFSTIFFTRVAMESFRKMAEDKGREAAFIMGLLYAVMAVGCAAVVLLGVWSNLAADNVRRGNAQIETQGDRTAVISDIRAKEAELRALPETIDLSLQADEATLTNLLTVGKQWGVPNLDSSPGGDCDKDLKWYPRSLCNQAVDLRSSISVAKTAIEKREKIKGELDALRAQVVDDVDSEGVEHLQEMAALFGDETQWKMAGNIATLIASLILLTISAVLADTMLERRQNAKGA